MPLTCRPGISEILPNKYRGVGLAWTELNLASWAIAGTLLANALLTHASWRVMYYIASEFDLRLHNLRPYWRGLIGIRSGIWRIFSHRHILRILPTVSPSS
jgi:MFS family permease